MKAKPYRTGGLPPSVPSTYLMSANHLARNAQNGRSGTIKNPERRAEYNAAIRNLPPKGTGKFTRYIPH